MRRILQLATAFALTATLAPVTAHGFAPPKNDAPPRADVEWIWQYTPDTINKDGRENDLVTDPRFEPFLEQFLAAPQSFWGTPVNGKHRSLANTALDHLTVPGKVLADENRYISISGAVVHFAPARGLLWLDLNGTRHLVVFAAIDWIKEGRATSDPAAEYTLWVFPDEPLSIAGNGEHPPPALIKDIARWAAQPLPGSGIVQNITHAILVDPDGTPHEVAPSVLGVAPPPAPSAPKVNP